MSMRPVKMHITLFSCLLLYCCTGQTTVSKVQPQNNQAERSGVIVCGAERLEVLLPLLEGKRVALVVNQTSLVGPVHLADTLLARGVRIVKIFAPEHGFRGSADAGEHIKDDIDARTKVKVISLYGSRKKPSDDDLKDVDVVLFDIQDVGARFYTFISTLHYLMEACVENNKELIVADRPNPNGWYVDGPVLKEAFRSFVGIAPIPVVHGLTVGEYAQMVNGEKWLPQGAQCSLRVVACISYDHTMRYALPVKPSPNLPNETAIYNYPSICFFEGTDISVGRGTDYPFQMIGSPNLTVRNFSFNPQSKPGATSPPHLNKVCFGFDLRRVNTTQPGINLSYLINTYKAMNDTSKFFLPNNFFDKLAGTDELRKQIVAGKTAEEIKASWKDELAAYKLIRRKYLLYKDFE